MPTSVCRNTENFFSDFNTFAVTEWHVLIVCAMHVIWVDNLTSWKTWWVVFWKYANTRVVPDFGSGSGKSGVRPFFGNPAKSASRQISTLICRMPVQLQYVRLTTGVFAILVLLGRWIYKIHCRSTNFAQNWQIVTQQRKHWTVLHLYSSRQHCWRH